MATALEIGREVFPDYDEETLDYVIWNRTGYPVFWPKRFKNAETALRTQLKAYRRALAGLREGEDLCDFCNRKARPSNNTQKLCTRCAFILDDDAGD